MDKEAARQLAKALSLILAVLTLLLFVLDVT